MMITSFLLAAAVSLPTPNPFVSPSSYPISHHNSAQTDSTPVDGPRISKQLTLDDAQYVPVLWCSAPTYKHIGDETVVIASTPLGLVKIRATGEDFTMVSNVPYPGREDVHAEGTDEAILDVMASIDEHRREKNDIRLLLSSWYMYYKLNVNTRTMPSGSYAVIDSDGYHYATFDRQNLVKSFDNNDVDAPMVPIKHRNVFEQLPPKIAAELSPSEGFSMDYKGLMGISMTYDGHLALASAGAVIITDRELEVKDYIIFPGERVENSIAVDEGNGIYVVTSQNMHKLVWTGEKLSQSENDGAWTSAYEVMPEGEAKERGAASHGSGTTPSLLGFGEDDDKLVIISDGSPNGANIVAFWRDEIPADFKQKPGTISRRIADQIPMTFGSGTTVEASPVTYDNGVIVIDSTYPDPGPVPGDLISSAFLAGTTRAAPRGLQKYDWLSEENKFVKSWAIADVDNTDWMPPAVSHANGLVYIANKKDDVYEYFAADWETGEIKATWRFPNDSVLWNTWGGITVFLEDGDFLLGGFFSVKRFDTGNLR
jgi:hypothetical protein